jgi:co-chaperonin GroES (HSP10)
MTKVGLYLPAGVADKEEVRSGSIVAIGPGQPLPPPQEEQEPWKEGYRTPRFLPMQARVGDYALFFRKAAIEITFEDDRFLVVPHGAILVVVRRGSDKAVPDELPDDL